MCYKLCKTTKGNYPLDSFLLFVEMPLCRLLLHSFSPPFAPRQPPTRGSSPRPFPGAALSRAQRYKPTAPAPLAARHAALTVQQHCVRLVQTICSNASNRLAD